MKKKLLPCALALMLLLGSCAQQPQEKAMGYIGSEQAKTVALQDAGLAAEGATFSDVVLDRRDGVEYYRVAFSAQEEEYSYDIDALTGVVVERRVPVATPIPSDSAAPSGTTPDAVTSATPQGQGSTSQVAENTAPPVGGITAEQAKTKALEHAGLTDSQVTFVKAKLDWDDGKQTYDVEFYTAEHKEYDYEIDAQTGAVISYDFDADDYAPPAATGTSISADRAKEIALAQVPGATAGDLREFETDYDDGRMAYEGTIIYSGREYDFEIDGYSGAIRSWESEPVNY